MRATRVIKQSFVSGVLLLLPLAVTVYVINLLVNWSLRFVNPVVRGTRLVQYTGDIELAAQLITLVVVLLTITLLGYLAQWSVGQQLFLRFGKVINIIPMVSTIYSSVRQVANSLVDRNTRYESVVLVEYPREGVYSLGFVTAESPDSVERVAEGDVYNVFLPNSPNPTAGRLVLVPGEQVHEIDMSVREGLRLIVTTGLGSEEEESIAFAELERKEGGADRAPQSPE